MLKRLVDVLGAMAAIVIFAPVMLIVAAVLWRTMGTPVLFTQIRSGRGGRQFQMYKFRTMTDARDQSGDLVADASRITPIGRLLRATSLDELPELWNVLRGEMSLVGPRPMLMDYLPYYTPRQARRHDVLPGMTGWAQVNGRNLLSWEERFALDTWYVENRSIGLDLRIMAMTLRLVVRRDGISPTGAEIMPRFDREPGARAVTPSAAPVALVDDRTPSTPRRVE